jgi:hypothetical protein
MAESKSVAPAEPAKGNSELSRSAISLRKLNNSSRSEQQPTIFQRDDGLFQLGLAGGAVSHFPFRAFAEAGLTALRRSEAGGRFGSKLASKPSGEPAMSDRVTVWRRLRQAIALPVYTVGLLLNYLSGALGWLAAWIAGDDWP